MMLPQILSLLLVLSTHSAPFLVASPLSASNHLPDAAPHNLSHLIFEVVSEVTREGISSALTLHRALQNESWADEHRATIADAIHDFKHAWEKLDSLSRDWVQTEQGWKNQQMKAHAEKSWKNQQSQVTSNPKKISPTSATSFRACLVLGLCVTATIQLQGRLVFDLFSAQIFSRLEVACSLGLATFIALSIFTDAPDEEAVNRNPLLLYIVQLLICFLAVLLTLPILVASHRSATRCMVITSIVPLASFLVLWMVAPLSIGKSFADSEWHDLRGLDWEDAHAIFATALICVLIVFKGFRIAHSFGFHGSFTEPFYIFHDRECAKYVSERIQSTVGSGEAPAFLPAAVQMPLIAAAYVVFLALVQMVVAGVRSRDHLVSFVLKNLIPLNGLFKSAGAPLPLDDLNFAMNRISVCYFLALAFTAVYICWLLHTVRSGYRRIFRSLAQGCSYPGESVVEKHGVGEFHAKWGTYFAGALMGNCIFALVVFTFIFFWIMFFLSLAEFWIILLKGWKWYLFYALLYCTRYAIFRWVIPQYIVTNDGVVLRRRVWALLFPTLTVLNFLLGFTAGILRFVVMWPYFLINFFRVDMTILPDEMTSWDWSLAPFISLVMHSHSRLNPIMHAVATHFAERHARPPPPAEELLLRLARTACTVVRRRLVQRHVHPEGTVEPTSDATDRQMATMQERLAMTGRARCSLVRNRWHLAKFLARNPSLRRSRAAAPAEAKATEERLVSAEWHGTCAAATDSNLR